MQLLFYLVYYHSTCFGHGSCPSSRVINKTVNAATSVCQCMWGEVVLSLVVCVHWIWVQCGWGVHKDSVAYWSSLLHHISTFLRVTMLLLYCSACVLCDRCIHTSPQFQFQFWFWERTEVAGSRIWAVEGADRAGWCDVLPKKACTRNVVGTGALSWWSWSARSVIVNATDTQHTSSVNGDSLPTD